MNLTELNCILAAHPEFEEGMKIISIEKLENGKHVIGFNAQGLTDEETLKHMKACQKALDGKISF